MKIYPLLHFKFVMNYKVYNFIIIITVFFQVLLNIIEFLLSVSESDDLCSELLNIYLYVVLT
jgi:hypothetical protein